MEARDQWVAAKAKPKEDPTAVARKAESRRAQERRLQQREEREERARCDVSAFRLRFWRDFPVNLGLRFGECFGTDRGMIERSLRRRRGATPTTFPRGRRTRAG